MTKTNLNILMLEDDPIDADLNTEQLKLLEEYNCHVKVVSNRSSYLQALKEWGPDIILSDYNLPQYNGLAALSDFIAQNLLIPFIFVTGTLNEETAADTIKAGAWDYVVKDRLFRLPLAVRAALKLREEKLIAEEAEKKIQRLLTAIGQTSVQIIVFDAQKKLEYINQRFTEITGIQPDDIRNEDTLPQIMKNPYIESILAHINSPNGQEFYRGEIENAKTNGLVKWELMSITPIKDPYGNITSYVAVKEDITQQKQNQENLKEALEKAENSDRLKDAFLQNLSHEIRTPMNAIVGFAELLKNSEAEIPNEIKEYATIISQSSNQLLTIVTDVLTMASIQTGHEKVINTIVHLEHFAGLISGMYKSVAVQKGLNFMFMKTNPFDPQSFITDETKLMQIITNLLDNAFKFTETGHIEVIYQLQDNQIQFLVKDSGIGISANAREVIFERFRQADSTIHTTYGGTGLGLAICKSFASMLGGDITVESTPGKGSTFCLSLPYVALPEKEKSSCISESCNLNKNGITILVAEDEALNYELIHAYFRKEPMTLLHAHNGYEALNIVEKNSNIDIVLMDIQMPVMDGVAAFREIRKIRHDIPIIALTAYAMEDEKKSFLEMGFNDYLSKPINKVLLLQSINKNMEVLH